METFQKILHYMLTKFVLILFLIIIWSCKKDDPDYLPVDPERGWFPESPVNLSALNTGFDDYNSDLEGYGQRIHLYYSTNYPKRGSDFDIKGVNIDITVNEAQDRLLLTLTNNTPPNGNQLLPLINTSASEVGPFSFHTNNESTWYFFYANDEKGQYDIKYAYKTRLENSIHGPYSAGVLNSGVCDFYATINSEQSKMMFSSYRGGQYDLYEIDITENNFTEWLNNGKNSASLNSVISSYANDKCPYINNKLMVFASDRPEGFGGYDLWYSVFREGQWSAPINFGPDINTEYDEFRPATTYFQDSKNDFMIFSSNRPNGKGGYDLYYVGIPKLIR